MRNPGNSFDIDLFEGRLYNDGTKYSKGRSYTSSMMEKATEDKTDL
jgi:hypothetical protein